MKVMQFQVGVIGTNCYLVYNEENMHGALVDPGGDAPQLLEQIRKLGVQLDYILLTHGHFDHIMAVTPIVRETGVKVVLHRDDFWLLKPESMRMFRHMARGYEEFTVDIAAEEGTEISVGGMTAAYLHTPGHTPGSCVIRMGNTLFTGDTLFRHECGRCDLEGGSFPQMLQSLRRLAELEGDYNVLPGHEGISTLDEERRMNPYIHQAMQG